MNGNVNPTIPPVEVYSPPVVPPTIPTAVASAPPPPKKGFPKAIIFVALGIILLGLLAFILPKLIGRMGKGGEVNLTWWGLWEDDSVVAPLIAEYQQANPNVKIQ